MQFLRGHRKKVNTIAFAPDGWTLASGGQDGIVRLWDLTNGEQKQGWADHRLPVYSVAFSPDGQLLASSGASPHLVFYKITEGEMLARPAHSLGLVQKVAFSPDGHYLATAGTQGLKCWQAAMVRRLLVFPPQPTWRSIWRSTGWGGAQALAFVPQSEHLVTGYGRAIRWWTGRTGQFRPDLLALPRKSSPVGIRALEFSPDGQWLAACCGPHLFVWNAATRDQVFHWQDGDLALQSLAFAPDGRLLAAVGNDRTVRMWHTAGWQLAGAFAFQVGRLFDVAFALDGMRAAAAGQAGIIVWDVDV